MKGNVSFHPVDLRFFDELIGPLLAGGKVNPEAYLDDAIRIRRTAGQARRYSRALEMILEGAEPPQAASQGSLWQTLRTTSRENLWQTVRAKVEQLSYQPDELTLRVKSLVEPDLHLNGRPFFITEGSADRVAELVDDYRAAPSAEAADSLALEQLVRLDATLAKQVRPDEGSNHSADMACRSELLAVLKGIYDVAHAAREGQQWGRLGSARRSAIDVLAHDMPWNAVALYSRVTPFWVAYDVDGLETICRLAEVEPPEQLVPAWRLFAEACAEVPEVRGSLRVELDGPTSVGAFVSPQDVPELQAFLNANGSRIIQVAARHGEGTACRVLLRKIRECVTYAEQRGLGYLETSGIRPPDLQDPPRM